MSGSQQLASLKKIRTSLLQENQFYQAQMRGFSDSTAIEPAIGQLRLPAELISLTKSRAALVAENQLYRTQLSDSTSRTSLNREQLERLQSDRAELNSRVAAAESEVEQLISCTNQGKPLISELLV